jgi:hypothetical protein
MTRSGTASPDALSSVSLGQTRRDEHAPRADAVRRDHVVVGRVPHHNDAAVLLPRPPNRLLKEKWLGLADTERFLTGRDLDRGDDRPGARQQPALDGICPIPVGADEVGAGEDRPLCFRDLRVGEVKVEADDDGVTRARQVE